MKANEAVQKAIGKFNNAAYRWLTKAQQGHQHRRKAFNKERGRRHPATLSASRRGKLRRT